MDQLYTFHEIVSFEEDDLHEFKGLEKIRDGNKVMQIILDYSKECINAFLNSHGGKVYFGIEDDGRVTGVKLSRNERDDLRKRISQIIHDNFYPSVSTEQYNLKLIPIQANEQDPELYVIEIQVLSGSSSIYWISQSKSNAYIRRHGGNFLMPPSMIEQRIKYGKDMTIDVHSNEIPTTESPQPISINDSSYCNYEDDKIIIAKASLICTCSLPIALNQGSIQIEFNKDSQPVVHLTHKNVVESLLVGLHTPLYWLARPFVNQVEDNVFLVELGSIKIRLSKLEAQDLCDCIDEVGEKYKQVIIDTENKLETWNYPLMQMDDISGVGLLRVRQELWELMHRFSREFDYAKGNSDWHIFHRQNISIRVSHGIVDHAFIWPKPHADSWSNLSTGYVDLVFRIWDNYLGFGSNKERLWQKSVGSHGIWTAHYAKEWIKNKFIPKVVEHFWQQEINKWGTEEQAETIFGQFLQIVKKYSSKDRTREMLEGYLHALLQGILDYETKHIPFSEITNPHELESYVNEIQEWFLLAFRKIPIQLILPYYRAFTVLVSQTDEKTINYQYVGEKFNIILLASEENIEEKLDLASYNWNMKNILNLLTQHMEEIERKGYEESEDADVISRAFLSIVCDGKIRFTQIQLNEAIEAVKPLWYQCRFEHRHVLPNRE